MDRTENLSPNGKHLYSHLFCSESGFCKAVNDTFIKKWKLYFMVHNLHMVIVGVFNRINVKKIKIHFIPIEPHPRKHCCHFIASESSYRFRIMGHYYQQNLQLFCSILIKSVNIWWLCIDHNQWTIKYKKQEIQGPYIQHTGV